MIKKTGFRNISYNTISNRYTCQYHYAGQVVKSTPFHSIKDALVYRSLIEEYLNNNGKLPISDEEFDEQSKLFITRYANGVKRFISKDINVHVRQNKKRVCYDVNCQIGNRDFAFTLYDKKEVELFEKEMKSLYELSAFEKKYPKYSEKLTRLHFLIYLNENRSPFITIPSLNRFKQIFENLDLPLVYRDFLMEVVVGSKTVSELARELNITRQAVNQYNEGEGPLSLIAKKLNINKD